MERDDGDVLSDDDKYAEVFFSSPYVMSWTPGWDSTPQPPDLKQTQGDCMSPELSHAIGIKASLTGTPQGRREKRRLVLERIGEGEDGGRRWDASPDVDESDEVWHPRL
ncbi:hypothetical protein Q7C36_020574 [Tachysurus vachellii]|uniref:Uncharacterized protein n=1 Tax=Tachysurus vachellii TaxID=175792 RepID=A0AA88LR65_TACVA|nr:hypothetical protein Q7C36_020574 [Tachysurus vachellii]